MTFANEMAAWAENTQQIKLQMGELTAGELRAVQSVVRMFAGKARGMTDNLSDRERKLVEAARDLLETIPEHIPIDGSFKRALRAYEPKRKVYTMPIWTHFVFSPNVSMREEPTGLCGNNRIVAYANGVHVSETQYNAIREALAKEEQ